MYKISFQGSIFLGCLSPPPWKKKRLLSFCTESSSYEEEGKKKALDAEEGVVKAERREFRRPFLCFRAYVMIFHLCKSLDARRLISLICVPFPDYYGKLMGKKALLIFN